MKKYPKFLQVKVDDTTIRQLKKIAKRNRRTMSDTMRLMIEREACLASQLPIQTSIPCLGKEG
jgi:antitoxin component of RelBE/YafQ-DinJ toxin-antitoxin module